MQLKKEPCGCQYGSADNPSDPDDNLFTELLKCTECGAVWTTAEDKSFHAAAETA